MVYIQALSSMRIIACILVPTHISLEELCILCGVSNREASPLFLYISVYLCVSLCISVYLCVSLRQEDHYIKEDLTTLSFPQRIQQVVISVGVVLPRKHRHRHGYTTSRHEGSQSQQTQSQRSTSPSTTRSKSRALGGISRLLSSPAPTSATSVCSSSTHLAMAPTSATAPSA